MTTLKAEKQRIHNHTYESETKKNKQKKAAYWIFKFGKRYEEKNKTISKNRR